MDIDEAIQDVLFRIGQEVKIHKLIDGNLILEIDYDKYTIEILEIFKKYLESNKLFKIHKTCCHL